jgi:hypothetical protein
MGRSTRPSGLGAWAAQTQAEGLRRMAEAYRRQGRIPEARALEERAARAANRARRPREDNPEED